MLEGDGVLGELSEDAYKVNMHVFFPRNGRSCTNPLCAFGEYIKSFRKNMQKGYEPFFY